MPIVCDHCWICASRVCLFIWFLATHSSQEDFAHHFVDFLLPPWSFCDEPPMAIALTGALSTFFSTFYISSEKFSWAAKYAKWYRPWPLGVLEYGWYSEGPFLELGSSLVIRALSGTESISSLSSWLKVGFRQSNEFWNIWPLATFILLLYLIDQTRRESMSALPRLFLGFVFSSLSLSLMNSTRSDSKFVSASNGMANCCRSLSKVADSFGLVAAAYPLYPSSSLTAATYRLCLNWSYTVTKAMPHSLDPFRTWSMNSLSLGVRSWRRTIFWTQFILRSFFLPTIWYMCVCFGSYTFRIF